MSSASSYTNKMRVVAQSRNLKAQYPGGVADAHNPLLSLLCVSNAPRWTPLKYTILCPCVFPAPPKEEVCIAEFLDAQAPAEVECLILDGNAVASDGVYDANAEC
jgi:hypothetical protein